MHAHFHTTLEESYNPPPRIILLPGSTIHNPQGESIPVQIQEQFYKAKGNKTAAAQPLHSCKAIWLPFEVDCNEPNRSNAKSSLAGHVCHEICSILNLGSSFHSTPGMYIGGGGYTQAHRVYMAWISVPFELSPIPQTLLQTYSSIFITFIASQKLTIIDTTYVIRNSRGNFECFCKPFLWDS